MTNDDLIKQLERAESKIDQLQRRIDQLERLSGTASLPKTMLLDENFVKRAFAVYGHVFVAGILIAVPFYCFIFLMSSLLGAFSGF